jgi:membrane-associated protease RseP (regulator of RpoE activity)
MFAPRDPNSRELTGRYSQMIEQARADSLAEFTHDETERTFFNLSTGKKLTVMLGGPFMNLVLAAVILTINFVGIGTWSPTTAVAQVITCTPTMSNPNGLASSDGSCVGSAPSAATVAGITNGSVIVRIGDVDINQWSDLGIALDSIPTGTAEIEEQIKRIELTEAQFETEPGQWETTPFLGVVPQAVLTRESLSAMPQLIYADTLAIAKSLASFPLEIIGLAANLVSSEPRDESGPVSVLGIGRFSGELAASDEFALLEKISFSLLMLGSLNLFMFVFNLVPLLPLDGGHVAGAIFEGLRRLNARLRRRPRPWPTDTARLLPLAHVITLALIAMSLVVLVADIIKPISLN